MNLKVYGLPRTGTNAIAYNIMRTWPHVKVWLDSGPEEKDHSKKAYWRHGRFKVVPGVGGYIVTDRGYDDWLGAVTRYPNFDERYAWFTWVGFGARFGGFYEMNRGKVMKAHHGHMGRTLERVQEKFGLPPAEYHIESKYMRRNDDLVPLDLWTTDDDYDDIRTQAGAINT